MFTARIRCASVHRPDQLSARSESSLLDVETVSDAIKGLDCIEFGIAFAKLAPDPLDVAVDRPVVDIDVFVIGDVEQLVARLDHAWALSERLQDQELGDRQGDALAVPQYLVTIGIHDQPAALEQR